MEAVVLLGVAVYVAPGIVASIRSTSNRMSVWVVTLFLGWTFVGWVVALAMALSGARTREDYAQQRREHADSRQQQRDERADARQQRALQAEQHRLSQLQQQRAEHRRRQQVEHRRQSQEHSTPRLPPPPP